MTVQFDACIEGLRELQDRIEESAHSDLQRSRCHVSRTVAKRALSLVAQRFLALVQVGNPLAESGGVADALNQHLQRRRSSLAS